VLRADETAVARGATSTLRGAVAVAEASLVHRARLARPALVNGEVGVVVAPPSLRADSPRTRASAAEDRRVELAEARGVRTRDDRDDSPARDRDGRHRERPTVACP